MPQQVEQLRTADPSAILAIELSDQFGRSRRLSDYRGHILVVYFYPRDETPGCTLEGKEFRDLNEKFRALECPIVGVSTDSSSSHRAFADKHGFPFTLLADTEHKTAEDYGVWEPMTWQGNTFMAAARTTFLIDKNGVIRKIFRKVKPEGHAAEVYAALKELT